MQELNRDTQFERTASPKWEVSGARWGSDRTIFSILGKEFPGRVTIDPHTTKPSRGTKTLIDGSTNRTFRPRLQSRIWQRIAGLRSSLARIRSIEPSNRRAAVQSSV